MTDTSKSIERFGALLDSYGADFDRWPTDDQAWGRSLISSNPIANAAYGQAAALDAALELAPRPHPHRIDNLTARIMSEAAKGAHNANRPAINPVPTSKVIQLPSRTAPVAKSTSSAARSKYVSETGTWRVAAGLALSLVLGVLIGAFELAPLPLRHLLESVEVGQDVELFTSALSADGISPALDEDDL